MKHMKRRSYGRDAGLTLRMVFTTAMLGLLYVIFAVVLFSVLNVGEWHHSHGRVLNRWPSCGLW